MELGVQPAHRKVENFRYIQDEINRLVLEKRITPVIIIDEANYISGSILNDLKILLTLRWIPGIVLLFSCQDFHHLTPHFA